MPERGEFDPYDQEELEADEDIEEEKSPAKKEKENPKIDKLENSFGLLPQQIRESEIGTTITKLIKKIKGAYLNLGAFEELDGAAEELNMLINSLNENEEDAEEIAKEDLVALKEKIDGIVE